MSNVVVEQVITQSIGRWPGWWVSQRRADGRCVEFRVVSFTGPAVADIDALPDDDNQYCHNILCPRHKVEWQRMDERAERLVQTLRNPWTRERFLLQADAPTGMFRIDFINDDVTLVPDPIVEATDDWTLALPISQAAAADRIIADARTKSLLPLHKQHFNLLEAMMEAVTANLESQGVNLLTGSGVSRTVLEDILDTDPEGYRGFLHVIEDCLRHILPDLIVRLKLVQ